jgi:hypothetical protein
LGPDFRPFVEKQNADLKEGSILSYTVLRANEAGEQKEVELKAPVAKVERKQKFVLSFNANATADQLAIRKAWLSAE